MKPEKFIGKLIDIADDILDANPDAIGISCGGPLDSKRSIIMCPPNLPDWDNVHIVEQVEKNFGVKAVLQNDANACAVAEWKFGAGKGSKNMVFMTFGTGLGAGLILNGGLYSGTNDNAGELGHIRLSEFGPVGYGKAGSFEGFCSGGDLAKLGYIKALDLKVIGLTGETGGKLKSAADICICAPETETFKIQELHVPIYHYLCAAIEEEFFKV